MTKRSSAAERLRRARKTAARELGRPITSWEVRRFALLAVAHDNITTRLANGADVRIDDLLKIDAAMAEIRSSVPQEAIKVEIEIVDPTPQSPPPDPPAPPPTPPPTKTKPSPPASSAPTNVVELPRPRSAGEPITDTMRRFNQLRGYGVAPDGGLRKGNPPRVGSLVW